MSYGINSRGYTILEVMIFLAVSGFMFVIAASFISGKQEKAEFRQSMSNINTQVKGTINDVANGHYPDAGQFSCSAGALGPPVFGPPSPSKSQGNNQGCVFLGKFIQFGDSTGTPARADKNYSIYSIVGRQYKGTIADGTLPSDFAESSPVVAPNLTDNKNTLFDIKITKMTSNSVDIVGVGFFNSFSSYNGASGKLESGAQNVSVVTFPAGGSYTRNQAASLMQAEIAARPAGTSVEENPNILICFTDGPKQFGTLTIGGPTGLRLATKIQISGTLPAGC